jgi:hypothetical protein
MTINRKLLLSLSLITVFFISNLGNLIHAHALEAKFQDNLVTTMSYDVNTTPEFSGAFIQKKTASIIMTVQNTGSSGTDLYNLDWVSEKPGWKAAFYDGYSTTLLKDSDGDGKPDTGWLDPGSSKDVLVVITPPSGAKAGAYTTITATATSKMNLGVSSQSNFTTAVPTTFGQAYTDEESNIRIGLFGEKTSIHTKMDGWFQGNTLTLTAFPQGHFIYSWEVSGNIEYTMLDRFGNTLISPPKKLTSSQNGGNHIMNRFPHVAINSSGNTGIAWIRSIYDPVDEKNNYNVFVTMLDLAGNPIWEDPVNVTGNDSFSSIFSTPRIKMMGETLTAAWVKSEWTGDGEEKDVWFAVYNQQGEVISPPTKVTNSAAGEIYFHSPSLIPLSQGRTMIVYSIKNLNNQTDILAFTIINSIGAILLPQSIISGSSGYGADGVHLPSSQVLLAWANDTSLGISYALLNADTFEITFGPENLHTLDGRKSDFVSVTQDNNGNVVLTWLDAVYNNHLYYSLLDGSGSVITPPLPFYTTYNSDTYVLTSYSGQGNTNYSGHWQVFMPVIIRR